MQKQQTTIEIVYILLGMGAIGLIIHAIYTCYLKNKKIEDEKNQIIENNNI
jgi:hypothetical protein